MRKKKCDRASGCADRDGNKTLADPPYNGAGHMAGRRDVAADCSDALDFAALRVAVGQVGHFLIGPAMRCIQIALTLWPDLTPQQDARIWEQDFGAWENVPYGDLADLGCLSACELSAHRPPGGESFLDPYARTKPALLDAITLEEEVAIVAHVGVIHAALGMTMNPPAQGLAFQTGPLSLTTIAAVPGGAFSIEGVNAT